MQHLDTNVTDSYIQFWASAIKGSQDPKKSLLKLNPPVTKKEIRQVLKYLKNDLQEDQKNNIKIYKEIDKRLLQIQEELLTLQDRSKDKFKLGPMDKVYYEYFLQIKDLEYEADQLLKERTFYDKNGTFLSSNPLQASKKSPQVSRAVPNNSRVSKPKISAIAPSSRQMSVSSLSQKNLFQSTPQKSNFQKPLPSSSPSISPRAPTKVILKFPCPPNSSFHAIDKNLNPLVSSKMMPQNPFERFLDRYDGTLLAWAKDFSEKGAKILDFENLFKAAEESTKSFKKELFVQFWTHLVTLLGHEWGINTIVSIEGRKIDTEGYDTPYALGRLANSVMNFFHWLKDDIKIDLPQQEKILEILSKAPLYSIDTSQAHQIIEDIKKGLPVLIGTGWESHSTQMIIFDNGNKFAYINRGNRSLGRTSGITFYHVDHPENIKEELIHKLQYEQKMRLESQQGKEFLEGLNKGSLQDILGLHQCGFIKMSDQQFGNCTWASSMGSFLALLVISNQQETRKDFEDHLKNLQDVKSIYNLWKWHDRLQQIIPFLSAHRSTKSKVKLSDQDHYKLLASSLYKLSLKMAKKKPKEEVNQKQIEGIQREIFDRIEEHFDEYSYKISDCIREHTAQATEEFLKILPEGAFYLRRKKVKEGSDYYRLSISQGEGKEVIHLNLKRCDQESFTLVGKDGEETHQFSTLNELKKFAGLKCPVHPDIEELRIRQPQSEAQEVPIDRTTSVLHLLPKGWEKN